MGKQKEIVFETNEERIAFYNTLLRSIQNLQELNAAIEKDKTPILEVLQKSMIEELEDSIAMLVDDLTQASPKRAQELARKIAADPAETVRYILDAIQAFFNEEVAPSAKEAMEEGKEAAELTEEQQSILNLPNNGLAMLNDDPFIRAITTKASQKIANYGKDKEIKILNSKGGLTNYHEAVLNTAIKAYRDKRVTKDGYIIFTENEAIRTMLGTDGTPSEKQKADFWQAWNDMREEQFTYITSETLADIMGIEQSKIEEILPGLQEERQKEIDDFFIQGLKRVKSQFINGKKTDVYMVKPCDILKKCLDTFPWYEDIEARTQRVMQTDAEGNLKIWGYSADRIGLQNYIFSWVYKRIRAKAKGEQISLQLPYETIFTDCNIDVSHRQKKKNRVQDVKTIFEHLKRCDEIKDFHEYKLKSGEVRGIEVVLYRQEITI